MLISFTLWLLKQPPVTERNAIFVFHQIYDLKIRLNANQLKIDPIPKVELYWKVVKLRIRPPLLIFRSGFVCNLNWRVVICMKAKAVTFSPFGRRSQRHHRPHNHQHHHRHPSAIRWICNSDQGRSCVQTATIIAKSHICAYTRIHTNPPFRMSNGEGLLRLWTEDNLHFVLVVSMSEHENGPFLNFHGSFAPCI